MNISKKAYILITNLGKENCFIHILDMLIPQSKNDTVINLSVDIDNISTPQNFYSSLLDLRTIDEINSLVYYPNKFHFGDLHIKVPIRISLNIDSFLWKNVVFEQKLEINVKCNQFLFKNNKCEGLTDFQLTIINNHEHIGNKNHIDFSGSSFVGDSLFQIIPSTTQKTANINTIFSGCVFGSQNQNSITDFKHLQFNGLANFANTTFYSSVYFNNSLFRGYADFHESKFDTTACFYGVTFEELPNFSACFFKEPRNVNLINLDISSFDFKKVVDFIENNFNDKQCMAEVQQNSDNKIEIEQKYKSKYAKNIKDSFRTIKDIFITQNNALEAQEWHKLELYAKEKETEFELKNLIKHTKKNNDLQNNELEPIKFNKEKFIILFKNIGCIFLLLKRLWYFIKSFVGALWTMISGVFDWLKKICKNILKCLYYLLCSDSTRNIKIFIRNILSQSNHSFKNMLNMTTWVDCIFLQIYRNTSDHHTNITKILNWTICMIALYALFNEILIKSGGLIEYPYITLIIVAFAVFMFITFLFLKLDDEKDNFLQHTFIGFFIVFIFLLMPMGIFGFFAHQLFFFIFYLLCIVICYYIFSCRLNIAIFLLRFFSYFIFVCVIILKPQLINPFIGIFSSDKLIENQLEIKLNTLNSNTIINLARISQKQFVLDYNTNDIPFTELDKAKKIIIANKSELERIITYLFDDKEQLKRFKEILTTFFAYNLSNLSNTIRNIDTGGDMYYVLIKALNSDFYIKTDDIAYNIFGNFSNLIKPDNKAYNIWGNFSNLIKPNDKAYKIFELQENQNKLKNVLSLIFLDKQFKLREIKQIIDYDNIINDTIKSTSIIYSIILLLCIFSLQKTARKNSIIPS